MTTYLIYLVVIIAVGFFAAKALTKKKGKGAAVVPPVVVPAPTYAEPAPVPEVVATPVPEGAKAPEPMTEAELVATDSRWDLRRPRVEAVEPPPPPAVVETVAPEVAPVVVPRQPVAVGADPGYGTWHPSSDRVVCDPPLYIPWNLPGCTNGQWSYFTSGCKVENNPNSEGFSFAQGKTLVIRLRTHADLSKTSLATNLGAVIALRSGDGGNTSQDMYMWISKDPLSNYADTSTNSKGGPPNMNIVLFFSSKETPQAELDKYGAVFTACELEPDTTYYLHIYKGTPQVVSMQVDLSSCMAESGPQAIFKTYQGT